MACIVDLPVVARHPTILVGYHHILTVTVRRSPSFLPSQLSGTAYFIALLIQHDQRHPYRRRRRPQRYPEISNYCSVSSLSGFCKGNVSSPIPVSITHLSLPQPEHLLPVILYNLSCSVRGPAACPRATDTF